MDIILPVPWNRPARQVSENRSSWHTLGTYIDITIDYHHTEMSISYEDLPLQRPGPPLNAWGQFGADDELGRLNLITPEVVKNGVAEVKHGIVVGLKYVNATDQC